MSYQRGSRRGESRRPGAAVLSTKDAATLLRVTERTVLRYIETGVLHAVRLPGGRLWCIRLSDIESILITQASA